MVPPIEGSFKVEIKTEQQAESIVDQLDKNERENLLAALNKKMGKAEPKKETKETAEKLPELDKENLRIDSKDWKEIVSPNNVKVKVNPEGDVREYLEGDHKGEQLFTFKSAVRESAKAGKKLPASRKTYKDIIDKKYEGNYKEFLKGENMKFCGWRSPNNEGFNNIDDEFLMRCADGSNFNGNSSKWYGSSWDSNYGFSVRCLKD